MEKVVVYFDMPGMTASQYDQIWQDLRATGHESPKGLLYHVGAATTNGWMVVDVWESAGHFNEFGKTLMPILVKNGVPPVEPIVLPVHYLYSGNTTNFSF